MSQNKLSIIIPLYNREDLIRETINSLFLQTYKNFECLIIDDHSTDSSLEVAMKVTQDDDRFIVQKREGHGKGAPVCRNEGIDMASGDYIMFLDSDDLLDPECLEKRLTSIKENPGKDFYVFNVAYFRHQDYIADFLGADISATNDTEAFLNYTGGWLISSTVFTAEFIKGGHYFDEEALSWQDVEFHLRAIAKTGNYKKFNTAAPDVYIRSAEQPSITSSSWSFEKIFSRIQLYLKVQKILKPGEYRSIFFFLYFKYLEMAARTLTRSEYKKLRRYWISNYDYRSAASLRMLKYVDLQSFLSGTGLRFFGAIFYRLVRKLPGVRLMPSRRRVILPQKIDLKNRFKKFSRKD